MRDTNTLDKREYIEYNIILGTCLFFSYLSYCFIPLPFFDTTRSVIVLGLMYLISIILGIKINMVNQRTFRRLFASLLLPLGIYTLLSYWDIAFDKAAIAAATAGILCLTYTLLALALLSPKARKSKKTAKHLLRGNSNVITVVLVCFMVFVVAADITGAEEIKKNTDLWKTRRELVKENLDSLLTFEEDQWLEADYKTRKKAIEDVVKTELEYLGVSKAPSLRIGLLSGDVIGQFHEDAEVIYIEQDLVKGDDPEKALTTTLHEVFHAYQEAVITAYENMDGEAKSLRYFDEARAFMENEADYISPEPGNYDAYEEQYLEKTADEFAFLITEAYYNLMRDLTEGESR